MVLRKSICPEALTLSQLRTQLNCNAQSTFCFAVFSLFCGFKKKTFFCYFWHGLAVVCLFVCNGCIVAKPYVVSKKQWAKVAINH